MNWKLVLYKIGKGALSGAISAAAVIQFADIPREKLVSVFLAAIVSGAFHGITNAIGQAKDAAVTP